MTVKAPPRSPVTGRIMEAGQIPVDGHTYARALVIAFDSVEQLRRAMNERKIELVVDLGVSEDDRATTATA